MINLSKHNKLKNLNYFVLNKGIKKLMYSNCETCHLMNFRVFKRNRIFIHQQKSKEFLYCNSNSMVSFRRDIIQTFFIIDLNIRSKEKQLKNMLWYGVVCGFGFNCMKHENNTFDPDKVIEINGVKGNILEHITKSFINIKNPSSTIDVFIYYEGNFCLIGDILYLNTIDIDEIKKGNFCYIPFYTFKKTRLSRGEYIRIGAIVIGTKDKTIIEIHESLYLHTIKNKNIMG